MWRKLSDAVKVLKRLLEQDYMKLSIAAKTWFMLGEKKGCASMDDLTALAPRFGWLVAAQQVQEAAELLEEVGLVKLTDR